MASYMVLNGTKSGNAFAIIHYSLICVTFLLCFFKFRAKGRPVLHLGPVASGRHVALNDQLRQEMAAKNGILAFDNELDSVVDSIYGSRKESYMLVRGIADYKDGTKGSKPWQQYSALMAAAVLKSIVENI